MSALTQTFAWKEYLPGSWTTTVNNRTFEIHNVFGQQPRPKGRGLQKPS